MMAIFGQIPLNDGIVGKYVADEYRARVLSVRYVISLGVSSPDGAVLFTHQAPLEVGRYRISEQADAAGEIQALVLTGAPDRPTGVYRGRSGWLVVTAVMNLGFAWTPGPAAAAAFAALLLTVAFGLIGTFSVLGQKPAPVLRHL